MVRKSGLWSHYSLAPAKTPFHRKLLECLGKCFTEVPELQADDARAAKIREVRRLLPFVLTGPLPSPERARDRAGRGVA